MTTAEYDELTPAETQARLVVLNRILEQEVQERVEHTKLLAQVMGMSVGRRGV
jgi:hypothetical protein